MDSMGSAIIEVALTMHIVTDGLAYLGLLLSDRLQEHEVWGTCSVGHM